MYIYRLCEHRIFSFIVWNCVLAFMMMVLIHKIFPHNTLAFPTDLPNNSFTRLILLGNLSQSGSPIGDQFLRPLLLPALGAFPWPVFLFSLPFIWQTNFLSSLLLAVNFPLLSRSVCDCVSVCVYMSLFVSVSASQQALSSQLVFLMWHLLSWPCLFSLTLNWPSRFLPFVRCFMPSHGPLESFSAAEFVSAVAYVCNYT